MEREQEEGVERVRATAGETEREGERERDETLLYYRSERVNRTTVASPRQLIRYSMNEQPFRLRDISHSSTV